MLLEAAANTCIEGLALEPNVHEEIDRLPLLSKFDVFLRMRFPRRGLSRGSRPVQALRELKRIRDLYAHPKPQQVVWEKWTKNEGVATSERSPLLRIATNPNFWRPDDAIAAMRGANEFLSYYFRGLCRFRPAQATSFLLSMDHTPTLDFEIWPALGRSTKRLLRGWKVDVSYLRISWL
jgi:hypothetical protein